MADVAIFVGGPSEDTAASGHFSVQCYARANGSLIAGYTVDLLYSDNAAQKQAVIEAAAISTLADIGITVSGSDKKTLFGAPSN